MIKNEDGIPWPMGVGFGLYFWFVVQPGVLDFIFDLPWLFKFVVLAFGTLIGFAGSIVFPFFLYETLRKLGVSESITWAVLGIGFVVIVALYGSTS